MVSLDRQLGFQNLQNKQNRYGIHLIDILPWRILALKRSCPASTTATAETYHLFNHIHQRWPGQWPGQFNQMKFPNLVRRAIQQSYSESSLAGTAQSSARQLSCPPGMLSSSFKSGTRPCRARSCCSSPPSLTSTTGIRSENRSPWHQRANFPAPQPASLHNAQIVQ